MHPEFHGDLCSRSIPVPKETGGNKNGAAKAPYGSHRLTLRLAAWLFPTIDTARLVLIRLDFSNEIS